MDTIFHEKQEGSLCAQHCLNVLLQGEYFNAVDLATLANALDEEERRRMEEGGINTEEYQRFLEQPSGNMDDSGYFSVQVISSALRVWNLELIPYSGQEAVSQAARADPRAQKAFICNYRNHWLTIRKLGQQWFNLNSLLSGPELISDTYLSIFLAQLMEEGYSIFVVIGSLPECESDRLLSVSPVDPSSVRRLQEAPSSEKQRHTSTTNEDDPCLKDVLRQSMEAFQQSQEESFQAALSLSLRGETPDEDEMLRRAIQMSMEPL